MTKIPFIAIALLGLHYQNDPVCWATLIALFLVVMTEIGAESTRHKNEVTARETEKRLALEYEFTCPACGATHEVGPFAEGVAHAK